MMNLTIEPLFQQLLVLSPFSERELSNLIITAPRRYKDHYIDKRHGRGKRLISQPTLELKFLQRLLVNDILFQLPLHDAAMAYRKNRSIKHHAMPHAASRYLLKLDFRDFFPSLNEGAIRHRLALDANFSNGELWILCHLLCRKPTDSDILQLSIGAPSSPFVSNYLMWEFDTKLAAFCSARNVIYTRYADDLAVSTHEPHVLDSIETEVHRLLNELNYLGISLNESKTINVSKKFRRTLVGLNLSNDGVVSIGRDKKRRLRAEMHALVCGKLPPENISRLRGMLAFVHAIDPDFVKNLCIKYGFNNPNEIK